MILEMILEITELWTAVYVPNLARIGAKICENAFRTIPKFLFFDAEKTFFFAKFSDQKVLVRKFCEVLDDARPNGRRHQLVRQILL